MALPRVKEGEVCITLSSRFWVFKSYLLGTKNNSESLRHEAVLKWAEVFLGFFTL